MGRVVLALASGGVRGRLGHQPLRAPLGDAPVKAGLECPGVVHLGHEAVGGRIAAGHRELAVDLPHQTLDGGLERLVLGDSLAARHHDLQEDLKAAQTLQGLVDAIDNDAKVAEQVEALTGRPLREVYGMTETSSVLTLAYAGRPLKLGSAGHALPYSRVRIVKVGSDGHALGDCAPDERYYAGVTNGVQLCSQ